MSQNLQIIIGVVAAVVLVLGLVLWRKSRVAKVSSTLTGTPQSHSLPTPPAPEVTDDRSNIATAPTRAGPTIEVQEAPPVSKPEPQSVPPAQPVGLRHRLGRSQGSLTAAFRGLFSSNGVSDDAWIDLEDTLIMADMGVQASANVIDHLKTAVKKSDVSDADAMLALAARELTTIVDAGLDRTLHLERHDDNPAVALTVGVNGTGKTTTTAKIAHLLSSSDKEVLLGAADTFRAAAAEQLTTWGDRIGVKVVRGEEGSDPASVAFNAVTEGKADNVDVVLIDTAGRLHTKQGLMDELGKVHRVVSKQAAVDEVLLVIDATTGQNGLAQAKVFSEVVPITGVVLSKLDGTAKGGIVVAVQQELGVPVKLVGLGEGLDDLAPFDPAEFVAGLLS